ncbi:hypothetical protein K402DRAFT_62040 [Aulographum hederae CBS 113979]|uniref:Uncharacterized protein n=1 Tax=Aulographum hederae CBS 113979 TaxID=1176131 RepID=A0A6G1H216_9PEZI|nr:hypothetical protein K402DRAFT_62040 [Aulographum hederae CBS 113979]
MLSAYPSGACPHTLAGLVHYLLQTFSSLYFLTCIQLSQLINLTERYSPALTCKSSESSFSIVFAFFQCDSKASTAPSRTFMACRLDQ